MGGGAIGAISLKYLLDENVDPLFCLQMSQQESDVVVWMVGDPGAPRRGTLDPEILIWCEEQEFVLVTNNRHSMPIHLADHLAMNRHVPGIFILNPKMTIGETIDELILIAGASLPNEFGDLITFLPYP